MLDISSLTRLENPQLKQKRTPQLERGTVIFQESRPLRDEVSFPIDKLWIPYGKERA
jgi:hypothetical protein